MSSYWNLILLAVAFALIIYLASKAIIGTYFKAKEGYINRLFEKLKGASNGNKE